MPRDLPVGNGQLFISYDCNGLLREFNYPHVGEESHLKEGVFRFGIWINGVFSWIPDGWKVSRNYLEDSLTTDLRFEKEEITIICNDCVDVNENIYLRKITVCNDGDQEKSVRLFLHHDFCIYGTDIGDTACFRPEESALLHYKKERYFLIDVLANNKFGIDSFATGSKQGNSDIGTWKDAEDGVLSGNPIAQGSVDSVLEIPLTCLAHEKTSCFYWISAGKSWEEVKELNHLVRKRTPSAMIERTHSYWVLWANKEAVSNLSEQILRLYKRSLLICRVHMDNCGSVIAANDSDCIHFNRDTYSYMWPRDGALTAHAMDLAGYTTTSFYLFCAKLQTKDGYFLHKYTSSGDLASSWHPWMKEHKPQLPIQEDETALVLWALWEHYQLRRDLEIIRPLYGPLIRRSADFMMNYRDLKTGLPLPSFDLWEERQGVLTFTLSTVYAGLSAAAKFSSLFGEHDLAKEYQEGAERIKEGLEKYLYLPNERRFARMITFQSDGSITVDPTIDASLYALFAFGAYPATHPYVESTMNQVKSALWNPSSGGLCRYPDDSYYRSGLSSNPWFITTLWLGQYYIARGELNSAMEILQWVANHALPSGILAEQISPQTHAPLSVSPLTWSHATFVATVQKYLRKQNE
jgi:glucoamylase